MSLHVEALEVNTMARFVLYGITCQDEQEREGDEVYILDRVDNDPNWHDAWVSKSDMKTGSVRSITWATDYFERIRIWILDSDGMARIAGQKAPGDDELGYFELTVPRNNTGMREQNLTATDRSSTYTISYEILNTSGEDPMSDWVVFTRLHCNDAKGSKDNVYLTLNNSPFWGPSKMRTGEDRTIDDGTVFIAGQCKLQLWEKDSAGDNDSLGSATIFAQSYGEANSDGEYNIQFRWRLSDRRDSLYTLYFRQTEGEVVS